jgi:cbb3-type cytochrome oxidase subunit 1
MSPLSRRWIYAAIIYFCLAVGLGVFMGLSGDHRLMAVHAHMNLLGWVSLALIGVIYHYFPKAAANRLASVQFWLHNLFLPVMMVSLALVRLGTPQAGPILGGTALVMLLAVLLFAGNLFWRRA